MHLGFHIHRRYVYLITRSLISGLYKEIEKENKCIKAVCVFAHIHSGENPVQFLWTQMLSTGFVTQQILLALVKKDFKTTCA